MGRQRTGHLRHAHYELETWASWVHTHQGENGVMGSQVMNWSGIVTDTPPKALVPRIDMPRNISLVDIAYSDAPKIHKTSIETKYIFMGRISRHAEDRMLEYISGILAGGRYEADRQTANGKPAANGASKVSQVVRIQTKTQEACRRNRK